MPRSDLNRVGDARTPSAHVFGFLGSVAHGATSYLSSGWPVAYLVATVILGLGLLVGALTHVSDPLQIAKPSSSVGNDNPASEPPMQFVGRITGMVDYQWADPATEAFNGASVPLGRKYAVASGLMQITYSTGAKVILQGPCTYEIESAAGGFLSVGKLTARVEKGNVVRSTEFEVRIGLPPVPTHSVLRTPYSVLPAGPSSLPTDH